MPQSFMRGLERTTRFVSLLFVLHAVAAVADPGKLVVVGGGAIGDEIRDRFIKEAGGKGIRLLIVPHASSLDTAGEKHAAPFREKGLRNVSILDLSDTATAVKAIEMADAIWFGGGQQNRLMDRLEAAGVVKVIRRRHAAGVVMGGTSAGAAVMSDLMIAGDSLPIDRGLALWPEVVVDQHFVARKRFNRSLRTIMRNPTRLGVGIGESAAVLVDPVEGTGEVLGAGVVTVIDARKADRIGKGEGEQRSWRGVRVDWLQPGQLFDYRK